MAIKVGDTVRVNSELPDVGAVTPEMREMRDSEFQVVGVITAGSCEGYVMDDRFNYLWRPDWLTVVTS